MKRRESLPLPPPVRLPEPEELELEGGDAPPRRVLRPVEQVPLEEAVGGWPPSPRVSIRPGAGDCPGERINRAVVEYLASGVEHGMYVPDPSDPQLRTLRVVAR
ncbi:amino acid decarboxylase [Streptomyces stelliscabiei]|uniref:amino acid decarboxylase n=1 Tax=Streptomyces stelliscabiei TaxID=146820 RepID=UPI002FF31423